MLDILYPYGYFVSLSGLILWFYFRDNRRMGRAMSQLFLMGFLVYLFALAYSSGSFSYKLMILCRDLVVLGLVSQFFGFFRRNKLIFFLMLAALYGVFYLKIFQVMQQTFPEHPQQTTAPTTFSPELDTEGELLVELKATYNPEAFEALMTRHGLAAKPAFAMANGGQTDLDEYFVVDVPSNKVSELANIEAILMESGMVDWVEGNERIYLDDNTTPSLARSRRQYPLNDPGLQRLWSFDWLKMDRLYKQLKQANLTPQKKAKIFILDTGVDANHEDLKANYKSHRSKYDNDPAGHGTHCAGIAAAVSNNGKGIASFSVDNRYTTVTSIKVLNGFGSGTQRGIINGMLEAADAGADIISMSLGGRSSRSKQRAYQQAVEYANKAGAIVIVAAGNSNMNAIDYAPANTPGVITVSAIDTAGNRAHFSNTVQDLKMGLAAPGVSIYSTIPNNQYDTYNGTSMATPYVAGLVGLMKSIYPDLDTPTAYRLLQQSGQATPAGAKTGPVIQPAKAMKALLGELKVVQ